MSRPDEAFTRRCAAPPSGRGRAISTDRILRHHPRCFGCGTANESGLGLSAAWNGEEALVTHSAPLDAEGGPGIVHGGYLGALADEAMGLVAAELAGAPAMTRRIELDFRAPTLTQREIAIRVWPEVRRTSGLIIRLEGRQAGTGVCFAAKGIFLVVPAAYWAERMAAQGRTSDTLDFGAGDPSTYFRWQLDGFRSGFDPARLARPVSVRLTMSDVDPAEWTLLADADGLVVVEGHRPDADGSLATDFRHWQYLTHGPRVGLAEAVAAGSAQVAGDAGAVDVLMEALCWPI